MGFDNFRLTGRPQGSTRRRKGNSPRRGKAGDALAPMPRPRKGKADRQPAPTTLPPEQLDRSAERAAVLISRIWLRWLEQYCELLGVLLLVCLGRLTFDGKLPRKISGKRSGPAPPTANDATATDQPDDLADQVNSLLREAARYGDNLRQAIENGTELPTLD